MILKSPKTLVTIWLPVLSSKWQHNFQHPRVFLPGISWKMREKLVHCPHVLFLKSHLFQKYEFSHEGPPASVVIGKSAPDEKMIKHGGHASNLGYFCSSSAHYNRKKQDQVISGKQLHFSSRNVIFFKELTLHIHINMWVFVCMYMCVCTYEAIFMENWFGENCNRFCLGIQILTNW